MVGSFHVYITNKDKNVLRFAVRRELLKREQEIRERETNSMTEIAFPKVKSCFVEIRWGESKNLTCL